MCCFTNPRTWLLQQQVARSFRAETGWLRGIRNGNPTHPPPRLHACMTLLTNLNMMSSQTLAVSRTLRKAGRSWYLSTVDLIGNSISLMPEHPATMQTR